MHSNRRVNETWAIVVLCDYAHSTRFFQGNAGGMDKRINEWIALSRIKDWEYVRRKYPRSDWEQKLKYYNSLFGLFPIKDFERGIVKYG